MGVLSDWVVMDWQPRYDYLVLVHAGWWMLTWHRPFCSGCEQKWDGWRFRWDRQASSFYASGLGFELTALFHDGWVKP
jgi:hypothetical protein